MSVQLSYSSATTLAGCEQRYHHYKIAKTPNDSDYDEGDAFNIGKAFHEVLELTNHDPADNAVTNLVKKSCTKYDVMDYALMIEAMVIAYVKLHRASGFKCIKCELQLTSETYIGFIDAIFTTEDGYWYIGDLKTAATFYAKSAVRLNKDPQLSLYSYFAPKFAGLLGLDFEKFRGCRYLVTTKPKLKQKAKESDRDFVKRLSLSAKSYDITIPKEDMDPAGAWSNFEDYYSRCLELWDGEAPKQNFKNCESFFKPCPYWSHCYGTKYTEALDRVELMGWQDYKRNNDIEDLL